ncbi:MAG: PAS domain-containing protein [Geobacter sp.]|nr:PAS domain-containing protein [Geobacter sp.]
MKHGLTIKSKIFLATATVLVCSYAILFLLSIITIKNFTADEIAKDLETALRFAKNQFNYRPDLVLEALKLPIASADTQKLFRNADASGLKAASRQWTKNLDFLEMLTFFDSQQAVISRINGKSDKGSFLSGLLLDTLFDRRQPIVTTELVSHEKFCEEVTVDVCKMLPEHEDVMVQLVLVPVVDGNGRIIGAIVAGDDVNKDPYLPDIQQKVFGKSVEMLITQKGERIATTMSGGDVVSPSLEPRVLQSLKGGYRFNGTTVLNGKAFEMIAEPILNNRGEFIGSIAVALAESSFKSIWHENFYNLLICGLLSIILIFVLSYLIAWQISARMRIFSEAATAIELGVFSTKVEGGGGHEFKVLAETFNRMSSSLEERDKIIQQQNESLSQLNLELNKNILERAEQYVAATALQRAVIKCFGDGLIIADEHCKIVQVNPAVESLLGAGVNELLGKHLVVVCEILQLTELQNLLETGSCEMAADHELVILQQFFQKQLRFCISGFRDDGGKHRGVLLKIQDVTDVGEVDRLKGGFIAKVSHELKTPLTSMKSSLQFILKKGKWLTGVEREMLDVCLRNTERLIGLITGILEITRIEAGQIQFSMRPLQIGEIVLYMLEEYKGVALAKNISLVNDIPMDLPKIYGDYERVSQVLSNLLSNAIKFSPPSSVVTLSAEVLESELAVSVGDAARVIPVECREALFSRFQQISSPEDGEFSGSGIGLSICREIVAKHGGTIYHAPGGSGGNVFTFRIPLAGELNDK